MRGHVLRRLRRSLLSSRALFVIQGLTEDGLGYIARVTAPHLLIMIAFVLLLTLFPGIVTILPRLRYG